MASSGIEPATFRFEAQCRDEVRYLPSGLVAECEESAPAYAATPLPPRPPRPLLLLTEPTADGAVTHICAVQVAQMKVRRLAA